MILHFPYFLHCWQRGDRSLTGNGDCRGGRGEPGGFFHLSRGDLIQLGEWMLQQPVQKCTEERIPRGRGVHSLYRHRIQMTAVSAQQNRASFCTHAHKDKRNLERFLQQPGAVQWVLATGKKDGFLVGQLEDITKAHGFSAEGFGLVQVLPQSGAKIGVEGF